MNSGGGSLTTWLPSASGGSFWTDGYFYETVGSVTAEARQFYVERCQHKHWPDQPEVAHQPQKTLLYFTN